MYSQESLMYHFMHLGMCNSNFEFLIKVNKYAPQLIDLKGKCK